jgi:hypothetical protein
MAGTVIQGCFARGVAQTKALPAHVVARLGLTGGQPLPADVRQKMEAAFGQRFHDVRVVVGPAAQTIGAIAFTQGARIHFAQGQYNPATAQGRRVLAHELAHVVQQRTGRVRNPYGSGTAIVHDAQLEAEAERMAARATLQMAPAQAPVQRKAAAGVPPSWNRASGPARGARNPVSPRIVQMKAALQRYVPRRAVIQRLRVSATILHALGAHNDAITNLANAFGVSSENLKSALLDPALDLGGAIEWGLHEGYLADPLGYASCYPTAEALHPLIGHGDVEEGGVNMFDSGGAVRQEVERLIAKMQQNENGPTDAVYRIEFAGHGFTLVAKTDADDNDVYKYELIDSVAGTSPIYTSMHAQLVLTPQLAKQHLRDMASDTIGTRRAAAAAMGWDADHIFLGADPKQDNKIDFPNIKLKWWAQRLHAHYDTRWIDQFKARFNALAKLKEHPELA